ncbi:MAG: flagellar filament capping protein FliD [Deltaproteobacteria bacterium]|nr:flagellar filament capping protein FliD [Deltaproteobacteria bacterium]
MALDVTFRASGTSLASGLDTAKLLTALTELESQPVKRIETKQAGIRAQLSQLGEVTSRLQAFQSATSSLSTGGVRAASVSSSNTSFSATPGTGAAEGRYNVEVQSLASAAKARSSAFTAETSPVTGGTLQLQVGAGSWTVDISDGATLTSVAASINASGAPVNAAVLNDGLRSYLSISAKNTGFDPTLGAASALQLTETSTGTVGQPLGVVVTQAAQNAVFDVDGLSFERQANSVSDAIPGMTLDLKSVGAAEELVVGRDIVASRKNVQTFADGYNKLVAYLQAQLNLGQTADRNTSLAGNSAVRSLKAAVQKLTSTAVDGLGGIRTLADVGLRTAKDGSLSVDNAVFQRAMNSDPEAVDRVFSEEGVGIGALVKEIADSNLQSADGILSSQVTGLNARLRALDTQRTQAQQRVERFRAGLIAKFSAMEQVISGLKQSGSYLTALSNAQAANK